MSETPDLPEQTRKLLELLDNVGTEYVKCRNATYMVYAPGVFYTFSMTEEQRESERQRSAAIVEQQEKINADARSAREQAFTEAMKHFEDVAETFLQRLIAEGIEQGGNPIDKLISAYRLNNATPEMIADVDSFVRQATRSVKAKHNPAPALPSGPTPHEWWNGPKAIEHGAAVGNLKLPGKDAKQKSKIMERIRQRAGDTLRYHRMGNRYVYHFDDWNNVVAGIRARSTKTTDNSDGIEQIDPAEIRQRTVDEKARSLAQKRSRE